MKKRTAILLIVIFATILISSCAGSDSYAPQSETSSAPHALARSSPGEVGNTYDGNLYAPAEAPEGSDWARNTLDYGESDLTVLATTSQSSSGSGTGSGSGGSDAATIPSEDLAEKIIYTANADIETVDFDQTIARIEQLIAMNNAFIQDSHIGGVNYSQSYYGQQTYRTANFSIRVPKEHFESVTGELDFLGNVVSLSTNAENITTQFYDTQSRLAAYRIQEERLLAMLEKAETVADMIAIESSLGEVRYHIESLTTTLRGWQGRVDYSTLTIRVFEVEQLTEIIPIQQTYWEQMGEGIGSTMKGIGAFFANLFKWIVVNLPVIAILLVLAIAAVIILRRVIRKKRENRQNRDDSQHNSGNSPPPLGEA